MASNYGARSVKDMEGRSIEATRTSNITQKPSGVDDRIAKPHSFELVEDVDTTYEEYEVMKANRKLQAVEYSKDLLSLHHDLLRDPTSIKVYREKTSTETVRGYCNGREQNPRRQVLVIGSSVANGQGSSRENQVEKCWFGPYSGTYLGGKGYGMHDRFGLEKGGWTGHVGEWLLREHDFSCYRNLAVGGSSTTFWEELMNLERTAQEDGYRLNLPQYEIVILGLGLGNEDFRLSDFDEWRSLARAVMYLNQLQTLCVKLIDLWTARGSIVDSPSNVTGGATIASSTDPTNTDSSSGKKTLVLGGVYPNDILTEANYLAFDYIITQLPYLVQNLEQHHPTVDGVLVDFHAAEANIFDEDNRGRWKNGLIGVLPEAGDGESEKALWWKKDGLHPNRHGHLAMANQAIKSIMARRAEVSAADRS